MRDDPNRITAKDMFVSVFKHHLTIDGAKVFMAGTPLTTPPTERMIQEWQRPWVFTRVLAVGLIFALIAYVDVAAIREVYSGYNASTFVLFSLGALIVPLSILIFYWEMNVPRDIPLYRVLLFFFIGGILSSTIIFFLGHYSITDGGRAYLAPLTEEPAKIIAAAIFIRMYNPRYIFGGMLIGAAVGAGFASFETIGYNFDGGFATLIKRSVLAIGGHVTWCAIEGGALVAAKGNERLSLKHFLSPQFLPYVASTMLMHFTWNVDVELHRFQAAENLTFDVKHLLLCCAAVGVSFILIKKAIAQVETAVREAQGQIISPEPVKEQRSERAESKKVSLIGLTGKFKGLTIPLDKRLIIGRDRQSCNVVFPADTPKVSRKHCMLELRADGVYIMDTGSSFGTYSESGERLPKNEWIKVRGKFFIGSDEIAFEINHYSR